MKKRKAIILYLFIFFSAYFVTAQNDFQKETNIGVKLGGNISRAGFDPVISQRLYYGFTGGLVFKHISEENLGIQIELNYMQAGWEENLDSTNSYERRLNYIQLPFMTHLIIGKRKTKFILHFGPYLSYLINESAKINIINESEEKEYYKVKVTNRVEFGLCLGLGFDHYTSIGIFQFECRYNFGLSNIFKNSTETPFTYSRNTTLELTALYSIDYVIIKKQFQSFSLNIKSLFSKKK